MYVNYMVIPRVCIVSQLCSCSRVQAENYYTLLACRTNLQCSPRWGGGGGEGVGRGWGEGEGEGEGGGEGEGEGEGGRGRGEGGDGIGSLTSTKKVPG